LSRPAAPVAARGAQAPVAARGAQAPDEETAIVAELNLERQEEIRAKLPSLANRRPEAYRWPQEAHA
jgi:predicted amidohydrolase